MIKNNLTYSELIYLFADKAISERSKIFNYDIHPTNEKIAVKPLSHKMVIAALVNLIEKGLISLSIKDVKKLFFFNGKDIFGKQLKEAGSDITGIEKKLFDNFKNETEVRKAIYYLLDDDETSPWGQIVRISKDSLLEKNYLYMEKERKNIFSVKRYLYDEIKIKEMMPIYEEAENTLKKFSNKNDIYKLVEGAVKNGIASRLEQSTTDD